MKNPFVRLVLRVGCSFWLDPTLNTSPMSYLGLGTWNPCEVVSPNFRDFNGWDCTDRSQATRDLRTWNPCEVLSPNFHAFNGWDCTDQSQATWEPMWSGKSQLPCFQQLRLLESIPIDLEAMWTGPKFIDFLVHYDKVAYDDLANYHILISCCNFGRVQNGGLDTPIHGTFLIQAQLDLSIPWTQGGPPILGT